MPELIDVVDRVWETLLRRPGLVMAGVTVGTVVVDAVAKAAAVYFLYDGQCIPPKSRTVAVCLVRSPGVVSSPSAGVAYAVVVAALVVAAALWCARWLRSPTWAVAFGLVVGGLLGNLVDRLVRAPAPPVGRVVDVFAIGSLDINVADGAVVVGVVVMAVLALAGRRIDAMLHPVEAPEQQGDELDPDDEKVALADRPKYPSRKWEPMPGTARHLGAQESGETGGGVDEDVADEDDRPAAKRPRHPANKWDR